MTLPLIYEIVGSQEGDESVDQPRSTLKYVMQNVLERVDASALAFAATPLTYRGLTINNIHLEPKGSGIWFADVLYTRYQARIPGSLVIQFDVTGEQGRIKNGFTARAFPRPSGIGSDGTVVPFNLAVGVENVNGEIKVNGIDELVPKFAFTITRVFGNVDEFPLTGDFVNAMEQCTGAINIDPVSILVQGIMLNFDPQELWFQGGTAVKGSDGHCEMVMKFAGSRGQDDVTIAGIEHCSAFGWDYVEAYYLEIVDSVSHKLVPICRQVTCTQTKPLADLNQLFA